MKLAKLVVFVLVAAAAVTISGSWLGETGIRGSLIGLSIAVVLSIASFVMVKQAQRNNARAHLFVMGGVVVSIAVIMLSLIGLSNVAADLGQPAGLTALACYLTYRALEVFEVNRVQKVKHGEGNV